MKFSYKRVCTRLMKSFSADFESNRVYNAKIIKFLNKLGTHIIQIDKFSVGHNFSTSYSLGPIGASHYVRSTKFVKSWSVMVGISSFRLEHVFIYYGNTNHQIFIDFIQSLIQKLLKYDNFRPENTILLFDEAAYHKTKAVDQLLKSNRLTALVSVPYTPEFLFVEIFNNFVKSKLRMQLKDGR